MPESAGAVHAGCDLTAGSGGRHTRGGTRQGAPGEADVAGAAGPAVGDTAGARADTADAGTQAGRAVGRRLPAGVRRATACNEGWVGSIVEAGELSGGHPRRASATATGTKRGEQRAVVGGTATTAVVAGAAATATLAVRSPGLCTGCRAVTRGVRARARHARRAATAAQLRTTGSTGAVGSPAGACRRRHRGRCR